MKKILVYTTGLVLGAALMACDGYKEPNPPAQSNPQQPILNAADVAVKNDLAASYDLTDLVETGANIQLASVSCDQLGAGYEFGAQAYISDDEFMTQYAVPVSSSKVDAQDVWNLYISPSALSSVYHENISWSNDEAAIQLRYNLTTIYTTSFGTQVAFVGGSDNFYGPYTVSITPLEADTHFYYLYTPGNVNGWSVDNSKPLYSTEEEGPFWGYVMLEGDYKFATGPDWSGTNYGAGDEDGILSTDGEAGNLSVDEAGLYYCDVNVVDLNYSVTLITTIGVIGSATPAGWDASTALTSDDNYIWTGTVHLVPGEYKFRANDGWDINLGGDPNSLTPGGDNIAFNGEEGDYTVTLNLRDIPYSCKVVAQ